MTLQSVDLAQAEVATEVAAGARLREGKKKGQEEGQEDDVDGCVHDAVAIGAELGCGWDLSSCEFHVRWGGVI